MFWCGRINLVSQHHNRSECCVYSTPTPPQNIRGHLDQLRQTRRAVPQCTAARGRPSVQRHSVLLAASQDLTSEMWWNLESCICMSSNKQSFKTRIFLFFWYIHIKNETIVIIMFISRWQNPKGKLKKNSFAFAEENISACLSSGILFYLSDLIF